jgi:general secretion pathway protein A
MYERFYNLRERPFALSPDPEYLYLSRVHREALDYVRYGIESRAGFIVITGEIGAGKTTLLQTLLQRVDDRTVVARLVNTTLDPRELLESIMLDFGLDTTGKSKPVLLRDLGQFLVQQRANGRRPLLVVDEAQNLSLQALEEIRLLSNLETEKSKLLQILLAGQPNLREKLASPALEQFRQRIAVSYHLTPLDAADTEAYINYRLQHAAIGRPPQFPSDAAAMIHALSRGIPRTINVICDAVLVFGYAEERREIDRGLVEEVVRELEETGVLPQGTGETMSAAATAAPMQTPAPAQTPAAVSSPEPARDIAPVVLAAPPQPPMTPQPTRVIAPSPASIPEQVPGAAPQPFTSAGMTDSRRDGVTVRRDADLAARERALEARERQIAEQRRIMAEEYRLLRQRAERTAPVAMTGRGGPSMHTAAPRPAGPRPSALDAPRSVNRHRSRGGLWQRIVRLFAGQPAV